jgi:NAD-dependent dihydropyrimidine dehydrogenase PreA subunit
MQDSTKKLSKSLGTGNAETAVHAYLYGRYVQHYIYHMAGKTGLVQKAPSERIPPETEELIEILANKVMREIVTVETSTYHGKIVPLALAEELVKIEEDVEIGEISESIIPYPIARSIVMENPQSLAVFDCGCRSLQEKPCLPLDVCLAVGDPLASFIVEHGVMNARSITQEEALEILRAEHRRGHVHGAYFKDVMDGRFYAICNCCSCCCVGMQAWNSMKLPMVCASGYRAEVGEGCNACGDCAEICPFFAIEAGDIAVVDREKCMGCGVCEGACSDGIIRLVLDPSKGEPLDIRALMEDAE